MKSFLNTAAAAVSLFVAGTSPAFADFLPEPSSFALVGLGLGAAVFFLSKNKKK